MAANVWHCYYDLLRNSRRLPAFCILLTKEEASLDFQQRAESRILNVRAQFYFHNGSVFVLHRVLSWVRPLLQAYLSKICQMDLQQLDQYHFRIRNHCFYHVSSLQVRSNSLRGKNRTSPRSRANTRNSKYRS